MNTDCVSEDMTDQIIMIHSLAKSDKKIKFF